MKIGRNQTESRSNTGLRPTPASAISPAPLRISVPLFAVSSVMFFLFLYVILPLLWDSSLPRFLTFNVVLVTPMLGLLAASLIAYRLEGWQISWPELRYRFRLNSMDGRSWLWTVALAVFMHGGRYALPITFAVVAIAILTGKSRSACPSSISLGSWPVYGHQLVHLAGRSVVGCHLATFRASLPPTIPWRLRT